MMVYQPPPLRPSKTARALLWAGWFCIAIAAVNLSVFLMWLVEAINEVGLR